jgi:hypothetical protein
LTLVFVSRGGKPKDLPHLLYALQSAVGGLQFIGDTDETRGGRGGFQIGEDGFPPLRSEAVSFFQ